MGTPFYDDGGAAGTLAGGGGWFLDRPWHIETETLETNPVADVHFQLVLSDFDPAAKVVTLYGGEVWGYTYTASDTPVPEPGTYGFAGGLVLVVIALVRRNRRSR